MPPTGSRPRPWCLPAIWVIAAGLAGAGCTCSPERAACRRDADCEDDQLCWEDGYCLPTAAARELGGHVGSQCGIQGGAQRGCYAFETCIMGSCDGPPDFLGAETAVTAGPTAVRVTWLPAHDTTPPEQIRYYVFAALEDAPFDWSAPVTVVTGETTAVAEGLTTNVRYRFVVQAEDRFGQIDGNEHEVTAVPGCVDFATQIQPVLASACTGCHAGTSPQRGLNLGSYDSLMVGSLLRKVITPCSSETSLLYLKISRALPPVGARMPFGGPYLDRETTDLFQQWIDQGAAPTCPIDPAICGNAQKPFFAGLATTRLIDANHAELCWPPATDDLTPTSEIVYEIYEATSPGAQDFTRLPRLTTNPGDNCAVLPGRVPLETNCWVVRARDGAGNRDANVVEQCLTMPPASCIEYRAVIQPLFDERCVHCHGNLRPFRDQSFESYSAALARGTVIIQRCSPEASTLYLKISRDVPPMGQRMPADGPPFLSPAQIESIRQWIAEGARESCADPDPC